jgi:hypothetical protein
MIGLPTPLANRKVAGVAQLVEQLIRNQQVAGSSPASSSSNGEVSERFKVPLSKSGVVKSHRGFESHPLRHLVGPRPLRARAVPWKNSVSRS